MPYANVGCVKLPDEVTDDQAIMISDIFPTAWFGARLAEVRDGDTVAVFGAGPGEGRTETPEEQFEQEVERTAPEHKDEGAFSIGEGAAPSMALRWAVRSVAKAGTIGIIGVYPPTVQAFPIGEAMNKNLSILAGNCNHRRYIPELLRLVTAGAVEPDQVLTQRGGIVSAV